MTMLRNNLRKRDFGWNSRRLHLPDSGLACPAGILALLDGRSTEHRRFPSIESVRRVGHIGRSVGRTLAPNLRPGAGAHDPGIVSPNAFDRRGRGSDLVPISPTAADSPWDSQARRPSHADNRTAWRPKQWGRSQRYAASLPTRRPHLLANNRRRNRDYFHVCTRRLSTLLDASPAHGRAALSGVPQECRLSARAQSEDQAGQRRCRLRFAAEQKREGAAPSVMFQPDRSRSVSETIIPASSGSAIQRLATKYETYEEVPWHRREPGPLVFLLVLLFTPITVALCIIALTGDVYRKAYDEDGNLQVWGPGNKVAAVLILFIQCFMIWAFSNDGIAGRTTLGPVTTAVLDDTCGKLIQIAQKH